MPRASNHSSVTLALALALAAATFGLYAQVGSHSFVSLDDDVCIYQNPALTAGISSTGLRWALTTGYHGNWTPLTWLSLLGDFELHGIAPKGYLLENAVLHATASALLFLAFLRMTRARGKSLVVAALFALHPLHVESVAWAAERKDVLSGLFFSLALLAHARASERPTFARRAWTFCAGAVGLLAKPMLVTLPFVLLLLDYWPLGRFRDPGEPTRRMDPQRIRTAIVEKLPLFVFATGVSVLTFLVQREAGAVASLDRLPFGVRAANAIVSYTDYLVQAVWPSGLAILYPPNPFHLAWWRVATAAFFVLATTVYCVRERVERPYAIVGWLWYLGMLVPVIGLVQVGFQARADRYTYLPLIGIFLFAVFGAEEVAGRSPPLRRALPALATALLAALAGITLRQLEFWRSSIPLFQHTLSVTEGNYAIHNALGKALGLAGRDDDAVTQYEEALRLRPDFAEAHFNLGNRLARLGREAEAIAQYEEALRLHPEYVDAHYNLANHLRRLGRWEEAITHYREALRLRPDFAPAHDQLGNTLASMGRMQDAIAEWRETLRIEPRFLDAHYHAGNYYASEGREELAISHYEEVLLLKPEFAEVHQSLGEILAKRGRTREAAAHFEEALRLLPSLAGASRDLAWLRATAPEAGDRDGGEAIRLAEQALLLDAMDPTKLDTLAAAYAEGGQFSEAIRTAERARDLARANGNAARAEEIDTRLALYRAGRPFHQNVFAPEPPSR